MDLEVQIEGWGPKIREISFLKSYFQNIAWCLDKKKY